MNNSELEQGEIRFDMNATHSGNRSLAELGLQTASLAVDNGFLRMRINFVSLDQNSIFASPTIEFDFTSPVEATHWICEFNGETILDKSDHKGNVSVLILDRNKISEFVQHHENVLIIHAEFPSEVEIDSAKSFIHFFK